MKGVILGFSGRGANDPLTLQVRAENGHLLDVPIERSTIKALVLAMELDKEDKEGMRDAYLKSLSTEQRERFLRSERALRANGVVRMAIAREERDEQK